MSHTNQQLISEPPETGGILNIDKPPGMTSHDVVTAVRRLSRIRRIGHTGTLDPLATGVLLLCIGRATRLSEYLTRQNKRYEAVLRLGQETNTYDAEGEIVAEKPVTVDQEALALALAHFRGSISQLPPMFSAVKKDGRPLYELARKGIETERQPREVTIYGLELLDWTPPNLCLDITCSSGTYIRSLAHDLGQLLGCGGHITALRRTAVGHFSVEEAIPLAALTAENWLNALLPSDTAVAHLPAAAFTQEETAALRQGQKVPKAADTSPHSLATLARAYDNTGLFIGIIEADANYWQPKKILVPSGS